MTENEPKEKALNLPPVERKKMSQILSSLTPEQRQYSVKWLADQGYIKRDSDFERHYDEFAKHYEKTEKHLSVLSEVIVSVQSNIGAKNNDLLENVNVRMNDLKFVVKDRTNSLLKSFEKIDCLEKQVNSTEKTLNELVDANVDVMRSKFFMFRYVGLLLLGVLIGYFMNTVLANFSTRIGVFPFWAHFVSILLLGLSLGVVGNNYFAYRR